ncbi:MAG: hypothetical protein IJV76_11640 [Clostridia bacterium]|nr:hypothetical protein [Clostridia bacterium]
MLKYLLIFLAIILIIKYFKVFLGILVVLSILAGIAYYIYYKSREHYLTWLDKRGIAPLSSSEIPENMRKALSDSERTILLSSGHIMSASFYEKLLHRINQQYFVTQKNFPELCQQCAVNFNSKNCALVSAYAVKKNNLLCHESDITEENYYLSSSLLNLYTKRFEKEGAVTHSEFVSKVLASVTAGIPAEEYTSLSETLLERLCTQGKATTVPLQPGNTLKETTLYCAVTRPENCRMTTTEISLD